MEFPSSCWGLLVSCFHRRSQKNQRKTCISTATGKKKLCDSQKVFPCQENLKKEVSQHSQGQKKLCDSQEVSVERGSCFGSPSQRWSLAISVLEFCSGASQLRSRPSNKELPLGTGGSPLASSGALGTHHGEVPQKLQLARASLQGPNPKTCNFLCCRASKLLTGPKGCRVMTDTDWVMTDTDWVASQTDEMKLLKPTCLSN